ncbi:hypothetical protein [Streptomyces sp. NPDC058671]|uniref:hypothetical protein n=1 Tax=Streptomyces sp. NPDC058671 TaxID=3346590 RepID=UPI00364D2163
MATVKSPVSFRTTAEEDGKGDSVQSGSTRIGKWRYTPPSTVCGETQNATLGNEDLKIDLRYSSSILDDFLQAMSVIQTEFGRRMGNVAAPATTAGECSGGSSHV